MNYKFTIFLLLAFVTQQYTWAQTETYTVKLAPFSSDKYNEFSPVYYYHGIVFCTNRSSGSFVDYSSSRGETTYNIDFIDTTKNVTWKKARPFSKNLNTPYNDGPVTFNSRGDTIYFSRNLKVNGKFSELSTGRNKLGIFSAVLEGKNWTKIRDLRFNNEYYNVTTPYLSPDGKRLYFASDKPDGYGGSDLYYSEWSGDYWNDPVNLGPVINTKGNESYPFINPAGELLFASDGHPGLGGKDIFFSRMDNNQWLPPVRLDPPINSQYDDFGIITDSLMSEGYFSSKRDKTVDIFRFKTNFPQIFYADIQKEKQYCFRFRDSGAIEIDTLNLRYRWDFGDNKKEYGKVMNHCYPGPGDYKVQLDIIDRATGNLFFNKLVYTLELRDFEQPYINSNDIAIAGEQVSFDGLKSYLPGYDILYYSWDFGEGTRMEGASVRHTFIAKGEYNVNLGLTLKSKTTGIINKTGVTKKITIVNDNPERTAFLTKKASVKTTLPNIREFINARIKSEYSAEQDLSKDALFRIILLSSKSRINLNSTTFRNLPDKYSLKETFDPEGGIYSYIADDQMTLMATYPSLRELYGLGFKDVQVKLSVIKDPVEKQLLSLKKNYGILTENYFDSNGQLKSSAYLMLDQIVMLMNQHPDIKIEIDVHSDNLGYFAKNLTLTQSRAQIMVNYLINRGIKSNRLVAKGYGGVKPVASNIFEKDRKLNRRVDFKVIK